MVKEAELARYLGVLPPGETDKMNEEQQKGAARAAMWGHGFLDYARILEEWRNDGKLEGYEVTSG
jgi:hypothetical protein